MSETASTTFMAPITVSREAGVALFGPAGAPEEEAPPGEPLDSDLLLEAERRYGIRVLPTP